MGRDTQHLGKEEEEEAGTQKENLRENKEEEESLQQLLCDRVAPVPVVKPNSGDSSSTSTRTSTCHSYKKGGWGARHTVVLLTFTGVTLTSMIRYGLSIAIVSMVARPSHMSHSTPALPQDGDVAEGGNGTVVSGGGDVCPAPPDALVDSSLNGTDTGFDWDERTQGLMLGTFFYGNVLTNVLGGRMAERMGSKPIILLSVFMSSVLSLLSPLAARMSTSVFIGVRFVLGLVQGIIMPAVSRFLVVWVPPYKRSKYQCFVYIGSEMGVVFALSLGGWLCAQPILGGWQAVFYGFGGVGVLWCVAWALAIQETPEHHTRITSEERKYLMTHCIVKKEKMSVPWRQVLRSLPFWAIAVMHLGYNCGYYAFVTELPAYLSNMQHFSIKSNGFMSGLPYLFKTCFAVIYSLVMDRVTAKGKLSILAIRRLAMVIASFVPAAALVVLCFVGCNSVAAVTVVCTAVGVTGASYSGLFCSHQDISPQFAGTLYGITNTIGNHAGFIVPAVIGVITYDNQTLQAWNTVFLGSALVYVVSGTFYIIFITDQVQPFNYPTQKDQVEAGFVEGKEEDATNETHKSQLLLPSPDDSKK